MHNAAEHVLEQVNALANQSTSEVEFEVIWVDNGSSDGTLQLVAEAIRGDDRMRVISAPEVQSSYFARNRGVALAKADLVLFCDADDVVDAHWVQSMASALRDLDIAGGALRLGIGKPPVVVSEPLHHFLPAAPTANLGVRKLTFEALGGFNGFIPSGEDWALCWRAQLAGFRFGFAPGAIVLHRPRRTAWERRKQRWTQGRWYRVWSAPFVPVGADAPTVRAASRRIVQQALLPAMRHPRRYHARIALWNMAVISSCLWKPRPLGA